MNEIGTPDQISEGLNAFLNAMPVTFIIFVVCTSIWWGIVKLDGSKITGYRYYNIGITIVLAGITYHFIPESKFVVGSGILHLLGSLIGQGIAIEWFIYWRKKKNGLITKKK